MQETKPSTAWAAISLFVSGLAWVVGLPLPVIDYNHLIGGTAGVGVIVPFLLGLVSGTLAVVGILLGLIALARTRGGAFGGRGRAWAGIALGVVLVITYLVVGWLAGFYSCTSSCHF